MPGLAGMAVSLDSPENHAGSSTTDRRRQVAVSLAAEVLEHGLPPAYPSTSMCRIVPLDALRGVAVTRQGLRVYRDALVRREDPRGRPYYWIGGEAPTGVAEEGTDFWALANGYVSVTPLQLDLTAHEHCPAIEAWGMKIG